MEDQITGSAALWGGFWGLLIGLLFLAPIFWGLFGALMGFIAGKSGDVGIDDKFIKDVGQFTGARWRRSLHAGDSGDHG